MKRLVFLAILAPLLLWASGSRALAVEIETPTMPAAEGALPTSEPEVAPPPPTPELLPTEGPKKIEVRLEGGKARLRYQQKDGTSGTFETEQEGALVRFTDDKGKGVEIQRQKDGATLKVKQEESEAQTRFPLSIDTETNQMTVTTPAGEVAVKILPKVAIENMLNSGIADKISETKLEVAEKIEGAPLVYKIKAQKEKRFLGLFAVKAPIEAAVSVETGKLLATKLPWYLKFAGFLFR